MQSVKTSQHSFAALRSVSCSSHRELRLRRQQRCSSSLHDIYQRSCAGRPLVFHLSSADPYKNLSVEHYLLTKTAPDSHILLLYTNRPCVVIGRNQNPWSECNLMQTQSGLDGRPVDIVRRRSGGGTVFHDMGNLNFSVIVPNDNDFTRRKHAEMVVRALKAIPPWLGHCKQYHDIWVNDRHDIIISKIIDGASQHFKASGSAFKLTRGRALHHGTLLHSSPNLDKISTFLKSAGRDFIQAKGVESVRSPVSNLFSIPADDCQMVKNIIVQAIVKEFGKLYGSVEEMVIGDTDVLETDISKGFEELLTNEWRFNQTPRFEFTSPVIAGQQVTMSVIHGMIEQCSIRELQGKKLVEVVEWSDHSDAQLATLLSQTFPSFPDQGGPSEVRRDHLVGSQEGRLLRKLDDGSLEIESGLNTVEQR